MTPRDNLLKKLRGKDYRLAFRAIGELRRLQDPSIVSTIVGYAAKDEQRQFQFRVAHIVLDHGVRGLAEKWTELGSPSWRATLLQEMGQFLDSWADDDGIIDVLVTALNETHDEICGRAVIVFRECLQVSHARGAIGKMQSWITAGRRQQIAQGIEAVLTRHRSNPRGLLWLSWYIELLGYTATQSDATAIALLEELRPLSGEPYRVETTHFDKSNLPWETQLVAEKKGLALSEIKRIGFIPTGLLDATVLETALKRIRSRKISASG